MTQEGFPLLDEFSIPEGGVCGAFSSEAAMEVMQTDDPKRPVGQENMEQQELTVETTDANHPTHAAQEGGVPSMVTDSNGRTIRVKPSGNGFLLEDEEHAGMSLYVTGEDFKQWMSDGTIKPLQDGTATVANAGGGLESNDVVPPEGLPTKAQDEQGGQDMENRENVLSMRQFPGFNDLPERERFLMRMAVMVDSDIAETPVDVLMDALDTIDNRRSDAEPTLEEQGYKTKILEELKNRGVEYKKASVDEQVYQEFLDAMRGSGAGSMQENFDVVTRQLGLGGQQIQEIAQRLTADGFEVEAGQKLGKIGGRS